MSHDEVVKDTASILIVDDEHQDRELLELMLAPCGFRLVSAASGAIALTAIAETAPDLILLDVMMPEMDGYQVLNRLKASAATKNIPVIMITALDDHQARMRGLESGAEDFLCKPVDHAELSARVRNLLRLKAYGDYHNKYGQMLEGEVSRRTADLVESEGLYRSTFEAAPVGIAHVSLGGRWLRVNQRLCDLFGFAREELQGSATGEVPRSHEASGEAEALSLMAAGTLGRYVIDEKRYRHRDGRDIWARVNMSVHPDADGHPQHYIFVIEDITDRRSLDAQLRQASKMDAIGSLAAGVAHDFNNLLSIVLSYSELLARGLPAGDPVRTDLDQIQEAGQRGVGLTRQLLAFGRQQVLAPSVIDLADVVEDMGQMLRRLIGEDVELVMPLRDRATAGVMVDAGQMEQVIMNLVVNARDAMPRGGKVSISIADVVLDSDYAAQHVGVKPGPHIVLSVTDSGIGMDAAIQARMFEPFFTTKEVGKGTGLGLSTVFGIVRQSGGTISVHSQPLAGTRFDILLPAVEGAVVARASLPVPDRRSLRGAETILLVEDDAHLRALARTILRNYGYNVLEAQSGGDAFLLCEQHMSTIHLLLTDVVMPRMSGRQLAERLLKVRPDMRVLFMSGYTDDAVLRHGIQGSTVDFVQKPITPEMLALRVRGALGLRLVGGVRDEVGAETCEARAAPPRR